MTLPINGYAAGALFPTNQSKGSKGRLSLGGVQGQSPCRGLGRSPSLHSATTARNTSIGTSVPSWSMCQNVQPLHEGAFCTSAPTL